MEKFIVILSTLRGVGDIKDDKDVCSMLMEARHNDAVKGNLLKDIREAINRNSIKINKILDHFYINGDGDEPYERDD